MLVYHAAKHNTLLASGDPVCLKSGPCAVRVGREQASQDVTQSQPTISGSQSGSHCERQELCVVFKTCNHKAEHVCIKNSTVLDGVQGQMLPCTPEL